MTFKISFLPYLNSRIYLNVCEFFSMGKKDTVQLFFSNFFFVYFDRNKIIFWEPLYGNLLLNLRKQFENVSIHKWLNVYTI